jgi:hypothetical protein
MLAKQFHSSLFDTKSLPWFHHLKAILFTNSTFFNVQELFILTTGCRIDVLTVVLMKIQVLWDFEEILEFSRKPTASRNGVKYLAAETA